jgi:hypothetical protein
MGERTRPAASRQTDNPVYGSIYRKDSRSGRCGAPKTDAEVKREQVVENSRAQPSLQAMIERLPDLVNSDAPLLQRGRHVTTDIMIELGAQPYFAAISQGRITGFQRGPIIMKSWSFAVRGAEEAWDKFWLPFPPRHFHDIFALVKQGAFHIEGDHRPLITNLLYFKGLLAAPRALRAKAS